MRNIHSLDKLWNIPTEPGITFSPNQTVKRPPAVRRYLEHAIAPGSPRATAVRIQMHGTIKLRESWYPFEAEQVIRWDHGFIWSAKVKMKGLPIVGDDRWLDGRGVMRWRLLGVIPVLTASGPDIDRSAMERMQIEAIWLPPVLLDPNTLWNESDATRIEAQIRLHGNSAGCEIALNELGQVRSVSIHRWGNPEGRGYSRVPFGAIVEEESTYGGFTVPSKLRTGWYFGTDRFETHGEFFRCIIDDANYR